VLDYIRVLQEKRGCNPALPAAGMIIQSGCVSPGSFFEQLFCLPKFKIDALFCQLLQAARLVTGPELL
jgi:hypothetical protein